MTCIRYIALWLVLILTASAGAQPIGPFLPAVKTGTISDPSLDEISGISFANAPGDQLWALNDSGNGPVLYKISTEGSLLGQYPVEGIRNKDWEDLAGFRHKDENFLVIADVGDNNARRRFCTLFFVKEPGPAAADGTPLPLAWQMRFRYEDGPRDCEALAVDVENRRILLLSKRDKHPGLYELPLVIPPEDILYTAKSIARITTLPRPTLKDLTEQYGKYRSQPTAMDLSPDGRTLVILTYKHVYVYRRPAGKSNTWAQALQSPPELVPLPLPNTGELVQREALCIDHATGRLFVTTEQLPAPIYRLDPKK